MIKIEKYIIIISFAKKFIIDLYINPFQIERSENGYPRSYSQRNVDN